ncbi:hypothetical protein SAFG77S_02715 [Streptomyces afghaniensis]
MDGVPVRGRGRGAIQTVRGESTWLGSHRAASAVARQQAARPPRATPGGKAAASRRRPVGEGTRGAEDGRAPGECRARPALPAAASAA